MVENDLMVLEKILDIFNLLENDKAYYLANLNPFHQDALCSVHISPVVLHFLKSYITFHLNKRQSSLPKDDLCQV